MNLLFELKDEFEGYLDKSLFFQDPRVIEGWLLLAGEIKEIKIEDGEENDKKWELRSEPYATSLIARRDLFLKYKELYHAYYDPLYKLWMSYSLDGDCVTVDAIEALKADNYDQILNVQDISQYLEEVNSRSNDARYFVYKTLTYIFNILQAIMNKAGQTVIDLKPSDEDFAEAIDNDLRGWTRAFGKRMLKNMREGILRRFGKKITEDNKYELWCEILRSDEDAIKMAMRQELTTCGNETQEHWGVDRKEQMDQNDKLMRQIYSSCYTDELIELRKAESTQPYICMLTQDNLEMFYDIIVRRSLIQCEMFPELKAQHDEWLNRGNEQLSKGDENMNVVEDNNPDTNCPNKKETKEGKGSTPEGGIRRSLERLMQERIMVKKKGKEVEEPLFNLQNHWQGVYRILVDKKYSMDADFEGFDVLICNAMPTVVNKPYSKESVKQISKTDFNIPFEKWKYNAETSGKRKVYDRMYAVAKRFKEILEEEGL